MSANKQITDTIIKQIKAQDPWLLPGLGMSRSTYGEDENGFTFLNFHVNGAKLKGWIRITLDEGQDTYIVQMFNSRMKEVFNQADVYVEDLPDILDKNAY